MFAFLSFFTSQKVERNTLTILYLSTFGYSAVDHKGLFRDGLNRSLRMIHLIVSKL
ncbi:hypothetical protein [Bartonella acomydis]|uniref:hypothetical protein n=1 Tax=Bartonella acomydis TaxID=686234 RepID=UPI0031EB4C7F